MSGNTAKAKRTRFLRVSRELRSPAANLPTVLRKVVLCNARSEVSQHVLCDTGVLTAFAVRDILYSPLDTVECRAVAAA